MDLNVTSFTLVWIKIERSPAMPPLCIVTSFTLVWIKIYAQAITNGFMRSRASRSCGLK